MRGGKNCSSRTYPSMSTITRISHCVLVGEDTKHRGCALRVIHFVLEGDTQNHPAEPLSSGPWAACCLTKIKGLIRQD